jgi:hypothetical protein
VARIASLLCGFKPDWFIAGGWAIDLFLGEETRSHADTEIAIFRRDQLELQDFLKPFKLKKAVNGELIDWEAGDFLDFPVHEIHCFDETEETPFLEVLLNEANEREWIYRRNQSITKPLSELYLTADSNVKFLRPEVVLLYKSKNPRAKDEQDFQTVIGHLDSQSKEWLRNALSVCYAKHHWLEVLEEL